MNVLSLFDGISAGQVALQRAGIKIDKYYASEIDEYAIKITQKNFPNTIQLGDVANLKPSIIGNKIDLLIGGSPCQGLASCNVYLKEGEYGVNGTGISSLFWHYVRLLRSIKPKYFFFENVSSMKKEDRTIISQELGVKPIMINSVLFSAQIRRRLYWTNIPFVIPTQRNTNAELKDIIVSQVPGKYYVCEGTLNYLINANNKQKKWNVGNTEFNPQFAHPVVASCWKIHRADTDTYIQTEYKPVGRSNVRRLTPLEEERLQTLPDNYTQVDGVPEKERHKCIGNSWTVETIAYIFKSIGNSEISNIPIQLKFEL